MGLATMARKDEGRKMQATAKKRVRPRTGYIMVQLTAAEREKLEGIKDRLEAERGIRVSLSEIFRSWLRTAE